jgi:hypothetical protein
MGCKDKYNDDDMSDDDNNDLYNVDSGFDINFPPISLTPPSPNPPNPLFFDSPSSVAEFWQIMKEISNRRKWLKDMGFLELDLDED